eukprot:TRINITY_DN38330_c0_g1_i1.p1 TRINITY_DN38330_c0_g1~~TRINITY_DN38330_c0_g1_i1.p1  ORF type:complete len:113 (+),score=30.26 TRINITY_DN38330_c0_g1_i1:141-479(+)
MATSDPMKQGGIQLLLAAEQEAQRIVSEARGAKTYRLRQAKEEAEHEAAAYRAQREEEYQRKKSGQSGDSDSTLKRLETETDAKIKQLGDEARSESKKVSDLLLKYVTTVTV